MQILQRAADRSGQTELAIDLSNIVGRLPSHGYLIIGDLSDGTRLSNGHDNGDGTWTLMFDELSDLKFLPGPVRGVVSLKAEIFSLDARADRSGQIRRQFPLILHTNDGVPWTPPDQRFHPKERAQTPSIGSAPNVDADQAVKLGDPHKASGGPSRTRPSQRVAAGTDASTDRSDQGSTDLNAVKTEPKALPKSMISVPLPESRAGHPGTGSGDTGVGQAHQAGSARFLSKTAQRWTEEVDRLFRDAVAELRQEAEQALAAAEQRRAVELKELSGAILKQHEVIVALREEAKQSRQEAANRLSEAEHRWRQAEAERMNMTRQEWIGEREGLKREADRQRSSAGELAAALAELKAESESEKQAFELRLKKAAADTERSLQCARVEWQKEIAHCLNAAGLQIHAILERSEKS